MQQNAVYLAIALFVYVVFLLGVSLFAQRKSRGTEDFLVAGRKLSYVFASATLLATWFGAGTLIETANEVRRSGLRNVVFEPFGAGICLLITGVFFARPLWNARLLTHNDLYGRRFGRRVEKISALYVIGFPPWIAVQFLATAGILHELFGFPLAAGVVCVAVTALAYTLLGGMWAVTLTDAIQVALAIVGVLVLGHEVYAHLGEGSALEGLRTTLARTPAEDSTFVPAGSLENVLRWTSLLLAATVGLIPSQDLLQRVFSARSARVAWISCVTAGVLYLAIGLVPILLGLASRVLEGTRLDTEADVAVIAALAKAFLSPKFGIIFILTIVSTVLSTIDSAILAASSVLAQNLLRHYARERYSVVRLTRGSAVLVTLVSVAFALSGQGAFELLESSYSIGVAPFVVLCFALYQRTTFHELPALLVLVLGLGLWIPENLGWLGEASTLWIALSSFAAYVISDRAVRWQRGRS